MGPLLFIIYTGNITCNITSCVKHCKVHQYADDTQLYYFFPPSDWLGAKRAIEDDIADLVLHSERHNLLINPLKSSVLVFGRDKEYVESVINLQIGNNLLNCEKVARNLGLYMDTDLRFKVHINKCLQKAYASLKMLYPHRHALSQNLKIKLTDA